MQVSNRVRESKIISAKALLERGQPDDALSLGQMMLAADETDAEAWRIVGAAYGDMGSFPEAEKSFLEVIKLEQEDINALLVLHFIRLRTGRLDEALQALASVLKIDPENEKAVTELFSLTKVIGRPERSDGIMRKLLTQVIKVVDSLDARGAYAPDLMNIKFCALMIMGDWSAAERAIRSNLERHPDDAGTLHNHGILLRSLGRNSEALEYFKKACISSPTLIAPKFGMADALLREGDMKNGWSMYEYRWLDDSCNSLKAKTAVPLWNGSYVEKLLVWPEQGLGEEIMFASLYRHLLSCCSELSVVCDHRLLNLFNESFPQKIEFISSEKFKASGGSLLGTVADAQVPIGSIPLAVGLGPLDGKISQDHFLTADLDRSKSLKQEIIGQSDPIIIGISWYSSSGANTRLSRNIPLQQLVAAIMSNTKKPIALVCLQYGEVDEEIRDVEASLGIKIYQPAALDLFKDVDSLAALTSCCDYVVTIDNVTAHLAGALGIPTHLLLPANPDWRWGAKSQQSYWYKSVSLLRQSELGMWCTPIQSLESRSWS